jgi:type III secretory pathway component EscV
VSASDPSEPIRLPPRPPRSLFVHWAIDTAVAGLAILFLGLIAGFSLMTIVVTAAILGLIAAPFTRRAERHALAARERDAQESPPDGE